MARNLSALLKADLSADLPKVVDKLRRKGRGNDKFLAHISPREARILKHLGGSGTINPHTGIMEFDDTFTQDFTPVQVDQAPPLTISGPSASDTPYGTTNLTFDQATSSGPVQPQTTTSSFGSLPSSFDSAGSSGSDWASGFYNYNPAILEQQAQYNPQPANVPLPPTNPFVQQQAQPESFDTVSPASQQATQTQLSPDQTQGGNAGGGTQQQQQQPGQQQNKDILGSLAAKIGADPLKYLLGLGGAGLGLYSSLAARGQASKQAGAISQLGTQQAALAQPFLQQGGTLYGSALQGALTPVNQQQFDAARAQLAQAAANTGGVGAMQATALAEQMRQQALQTQLNSGLALLQTGDATMNAAISTQIQAQMYSGQLQQQAAQASGTFFAALAKVFGSAA